MIARTNFTKGLPCDHAGDSDPGHVGTSEELEGLLEGLGEQLAGRGCVSYNRLGNSDPELTPPLLVP